MPELVLTLRKAMHDEHVMACSHILIRLFPTLTAQLTFMVQFAGNSSDIAAHSSVLAW